MKSRKIQLAIAAGLFFAWIGWLIYLAATNVRPIVLSRPQFLGANLFVVAEVKEGVAEKADREVVIREVLWPTDDEHKQLEKQAVVVENLPECSQRFGYMGENTYILALSKKRESDKSLSYRVAPIPRSPGYSPQLPDPKTQNVPAPIYRATAQTLQQARELVKEFHPN